MGSFVSSPPMGLSSPAMRRRAQQMASGVVAAAGGLVFAAVEGAEGPLEAETGRESLFMERD